MQIVKIVYLSAIFLITFIVNIHSQTLKVLDRETRKPIDGATISILDNGNTLNFVSNLQGEISLQEVNLVDTSSLIIQHLLYKTKSIALNELSIAEFQVYLDLKVITLEEVVLSANKWEQERKHIPNEIVRLSAKQIAFNNPQTTADLLAQSGQVFVQKSQMGGGSPMIRGFAANRVLIVVDGVRMNNAIYRSGNLQNVITIDPNTLEEAEVVFGPGSVIYGSDALGGVMDYHTKKPELSVDSGKINVFGAAMGRYSSANNEQTGNVQFNIGGKKTGAFTSFTFSDFGDLRAGNKRKSDYPDFGKRLEYVSSVNGEDIVVQNEDVNLQRFSAYSQWNILQKLLFKPSKNLEFQYNFQYSTSSDIPRYDRLIERRNGQLRSAEWYYGPQKWLFNSFNLKVKSNSKFTDQIRLIGAWQKVEESRHDRRFGRSNLRSRTENVEVLSLNLDAQKIGDSDKNQLFYGIEFTNNQVNSKGENRNIFTQEITPTASRYPDGGSSVNTIASYLSFKKLLAPKTTLTSGLRFSHVFLNANFSDTTFFNFPFQEAKVNTGALNGSLGLTYRPQKDTQLNLNFSTGFRAPNVDDMGKVFDSEPGIVIVPNPDLKSEYAYNGELGFMKVFGESVQVNLTAYYTFLSNAMVRRPFLFNGQDSIIYDSELSQVQALTNTGKAQVYGLSALLKVELSPKFILRSSLTISEGEDLEENVPLRHVTPTFGETTLIYNHKKLHAELKATYNGWMRTEDLAPSERAKTHLYTPDGSPSWTTFNFKSSYRINYNFSINGGVENIFDLHYRPYGSGISAAGRNFIVAIRGQF